MWFQLGDILFLNISKEYFTSQVGMASALLQKYDGPFEVIEKIGKVAYKFKLPKHMHSFHLDLHVIQLKACDFDKGKPRRNLSSWAPAMWTIQTEKLRKC